MIGKPENELLRSSTGLEGGVVASGSTCGVFSGGAMGLALSHHDEIMEKGMNVRDMNYSDILKTFAVGHKNLLKDKPVETPEPFIVGKEIISNFKKNAGAIECQAITGMKFTDWSDFQNYISSSDRCSGLIEFAKDQASAAIEKYSLLEQN